MNLYKKKIMVIDDDYDINNLFKMFLEHGGYIVDGFIDPIDALYFFRKDQYDLVLLDLMMPKMDGLVLYHRLKRIDNKVLIWFITANNEYIQRLKEQNPDIEKIVIYKPILLNQLLKKVNSFFLLKEYKRKRNELVQYV